MNKYCSLIVIASLLMLNACSSSAPEPKPLTVIIYAGESINPSDLSPGNPVSLRLYQLSAVKDFQSAQVLDLYQQDTKLLANTLLYKQNIGGVLPKEQRILELNIQPGTKYLAVFAQFSNYPQAKSKAWLDISKLDELASVTLSLESLSVNAQPVLVESFWSW